MIKTINKVVHRSWANLSYRREVDIQLPEAIVSFTFDDAPVSAFTNGGGLLYEFDYRGTFYVALSLLREQQQAANFTAQHLRVARVQGHELACHTHDHLDVSQVSFRQLERDIRNNQYQLDRTLPGTVFRNFAFPFGAQTRKSKQWLATQYRSARGNRSGLNYGPTDLMNLKGIRLYEQTHSLTSIEQAIQRAIQNKAWLIFYTHGVETPPPADGCSPAYFKRVLELCREAQLKVLPVDEALDLI